MNNLKKAAIWTSAALIVGGVVAREAYDKWPELEARLRADACNVTPNCGGHYSGDFQWPKTPRNQMAVRDGFPLKN